jgi:hypothetical protein
MQTMRSPALYALGGAVLPISSLALAAPVSAPAGSLSREEIGELGKIVPGHSTKADMRALFGELWRVVQFNDCGEAMDDQGDETWEYRGTDGKGGFRLHVEFNDNGTVHLFAKIPDQAPG